MFLNENNGYNYTAVVNIEVNGERNIYATIDGKILDVLSSISILKVPNNIRLYPNPTNKFFKLSGLENTSINNIKIYYLTGKFIKRATVSSVNNFIEIDELKSGVYLVTYYKNDIQTITKKLVIN